MWNFFYVKNYSKYSAIIFGSFYNALQVYLQENLQSKSGRKREKSWIEHGENGVET